MNLKNELYVVYDDKLNQTKGLAHGVPSGPLFIYVLGVWYQGKNLTRGKIATRYNDFFGVPMREEGELFGPFNSEEEMKKFMYLIGEEIGAPTIKFICLKELSDLVHRASSVESLQVSIRDTSESMKNLDSKETNSSLIHKIFNKNE